MTLKRDEHISDEHIIYKKKVHFMTIDGSTENLFYAKQAFLSVCTTMLHSTENNNKMGWLGVPYKPEFYL